MVAVDVDDNPVIGMVGYHPFWEGRPTLAHPGPGNFASFRLPAPPEVRFVPSFATIDEADGQPAGAAIWAKLLESSGTPRLRDEFPLATVAHRPSTQGSALTG